jgi:thiol-disulfide isomerase/thioredoxin
VVAASAALATPAFATETKAFDPQSFAAAQKAGKPIFVAIHASWCPTCKTQKPILSELMAEPKFKNLVYFHRGLRPSERRGEILPSAHAIDADRV